jgi:energy-coupling factor transport system ATP-binding protein
VADKGLEAVMDDLLPILSTDELSFRFPGIEGAAGVTVLDRLSFTVARNRSTILFGRADAGKTTLARIAAGLIPRFTGGALSGVVRMDGRDTTRVPPYELMQDLGLVAQDSEEQILTTRCDSEVAFALESLGIPRAQIRERVDSSLLRAGLSGFEHRNPATLSGGEKKRLLVACLDAVRPGLWILDEALGELDFEWKIRVLDLVADARGTALLMESRWSSLADARGKSFYLMDKGRIRAQAADPTEPSFASEMTEAGLRPGPGRKARPRAAGDFLGVKGLEFHFEGAAGFSLAVDSLELRFGEICALVGKNGSGKSTLGKLLCGLLLPARGGIGLGGKWGFKTAQPGELGRRVGYLFQNPDHQIYLPTVREELGLGLRRQGGDRREIEAQVAEAAVVFGLPDLGAPPALLSYGARRRLQAATYYLLSRDLLVLDEVDSGLSYREVESLIDALASRVPGIVLITHDMALAKAACDRILVMEGGRISVDAPSEGFDSADVFRSLASMP